MSKMLFVKTPKQIVEELDKYIIGQNSAKRAVAIALRNRYRRKFVSDELKNEITPKNILMIGATGVGKTEIARRLACLDGAPFIKVEATKFTEIGYVGRDVDSIIRDLIDIAIKLVREEEIKNVRFKAEISAEEKLLDILLSVDSELSQKDCDIRQLFRRKLRDGLLDNKEIEVELSQSLTGVEIMSIPGMEEMTSQLQGILRSLSGNRKKKRKMIVREALKLLIDEEAFKLLNEDDIKIKAIDRVEQNGIVFLDEIDKIVQCSEKKVGIDVSREGVQRDLLPLIEGCNVVTKYGIVKTNYILFIAAGAFHISKVSDLIPELQGRLPIRVKLDSLQVDDFVRILVEPKASLVKQYRDLLSVEGVNLEFTSSSISCIAKIAYDINEHSENIGARRLHTVMEKLLEDVLFDSVCEEYKDFFIDDEYVYKKLGKLEYNGDLNKFIL
ncbi:MAG TPA: ATP-dependent protease ATPase subunit HslU [Candidatus Azoamicus sp. OHIO1]